MKSLSELEHVFENTIDNWLTSLQKDNKALWGNMDAQQMIEHLTIALEVSTGKRIVELVSPIDKVEKIKNIGLLSDRPLQRDFKNVALPLDPISHMHADIATAITVLKTELKLFKNYYTAQPTIKHMHNVFGELNYHEWLWMHYKHFIHHFTQFGVLPPADKIV